MHRSLRSAFKGWRSLQQVFRNVLQCVFLQKTRRLSSPNNEKDKQLDKLLCRLSRAGQIGILMQSKGNMLIHLLIWIGPPVLDKVKPLAESVSSSTSGFGSFLIVFLGLYHQIREVNPGDTGLQLDTTGEIGQFAETGRHPDLHWAPCCALFFSRSPWRWWRPLRGGWGGSFLVLNMWVHPSSVMLSVQDVRFPRLEKPWKLEPSQVKTVKTTHLQGFRTDWWLNMENDHLWLRWIKSTNDVCDWLCKCIEC